MSHDADDERWRRGAADLDGWGSSSSLVTSATTMPGGCDADVDRQPRVIAQCPSPKDVVTHGVRIREEIQ